MKPVKIILIILALFSCFIIGQCYFIQKKLGRIITEERFIGMVLETYIQENGGAFPESQVELEKNGLLRTPEKYESYQVMLGPQNWAKVNFESFIIEYGAMAEDYFVKDGRLYSRKTQSPALLLYPMDYEKITERLNPEIFEHISVELYNEMNQYQNENP